MTDTMTWCDDYLPDLYDVGMFDEEDTHDAVWEAFESLLADTVLDYIDDPITRDELHDEILDAAQEWFRAHHELMLESLTADPPTALLKRPQTDQHSADWYSQRAARLTASEFAQILDGRRAALLRSKLSAGIAAAAAAAASDTDTPTPFHQRPIAIAQPDGEMTATLWGHRFESITRAIYEQELAGSGTVNDTLGRFQHLTTPWLSASPDGVVLSGERAGRLVEIKSPKTRQPGEFVPSDYYAQMQVQMEVCDAAAVDFVEAQFAQRPVFHYMMGGWLTLSDDDMESIKDARWKGRVQVYGHAEAPDTWTYRYTLPVEDLEDAAATYISVAPADLPLLEESIWWLTGFYPRTVLRNHTWWEETGWPAASMFWAELESLRGDPASAASVLAAATTRVTVIKDEGGDSASAVEHTLIPMGGCGADPDIITHVGGSGWMGRLL